MTPEGGVGLGDDIGIVDDQPRETDCSRGKGHRHAMVAMRVNHRRLCADGDALAIPRDGIIAP